jgi:hypothetical protein
MPELSFVDGLVGYLQYRIAHDRSAEREVQLKQARLAVASFAEYERSEKHTDSIALAAEKSVRGVLALVAADSTTAGMDSANALFKQAVLLTPYNGASWNLKAITDVSLCCLQGKSGNPSTAINDFMNAIAAEPDNEQAMHNLRSLYLLIASSRTIESPFKASELARRIEELTALHSAASESRGRAEGLP